MKTCKFIKNISSQMAITKLLSFFIFLNFFGLTDAWAQFPVRVNTTIKQPVSPYLPEIMGDIQGQRYHRLGADFTRQVNVHLTNTGNTQAHIKLMGKIERLSPSPASISVSQSYQASQPIILNPNQSLIINPQILDEAFGGFDQNNVTFSNISMADLKDGGINYKLPEGVYQVCISAYDFDVPGFSVPLSIMGSGCATFRICYSASAPQLVMPISTMARTHSNFEDYTSRSPQIQFTWTPPTSTCGLPLGAISYDLVIHRAYPGQTVQDALNTPPLFQKTNIRTNTFLLDTLKYPHVLRDGFRYVTRIKANILKTPNSPLEIQNDGYSELGAFTYRLPKSVFTQGEVKEEEEKEVAISETPQYATNQISGRLTWAFKDSEEKFANTTSFSSASANLSLPDNSLNQNSQQVTPNINFANTPIGTYLENNEINEVHAVAMGLVDPTLSVLNTGNTIEGYYTGSNINLTNSPAFTDASDFITSFGAKSVQYRYKNSGIDTAKNRYPLGGVTIVLKGKRKENLILSSVNLNNIQAVGNSLNLKEDVVAAGLRTDETWKKIFPASNNTNVNNNQPDNNFTQKTLAENPVQVLATAQTDENGNYTLSFINPKYITGTEQYDELYLEVNASGFYTWKKNIELSELDSIRQTDIGENTLLANTYRLQVKVNAPNLDGNQIQLENIKVEIYREKNLLTQAPYLQQEGNLKENQRTSKTINGKKFIKIAADSLLNETGFSFGKLFYEGELRVFIHSENNNTKDFQTSLYVQAKDISPSQVLSVETEYEIPLTRPSIEGTVSLQAGDNTVGIRDAIVKVSFDREDVLYNIPNTPLITPPTQISTGGALSQDQSPIYQISSTESNLIGQSTAYTPEGLAFPMQMSSSTETGNLSLSPAVNISEFESPFAQISPEIVNLFRPNPDDYGRYTARTDSKGHYFVGDLPELKDGAQYTVEVVSVPSQYENMEISPANGIQSISVNKGRVEIADFIIEAEAVPLTGRVVDINGKGLGNAKLYFNGGKTFFESDEKGYFQTSFSPGTHVLNIEKRGYSNKKGNVVIYGNKKPEAKKPLIEEVQSTSNTESTGFMSTSNFQVVNGSLVNGQISSPAFPISSTVVDHIVNKPEFDIKENEYIGEIGYLKEKRAKVKFIVKDADNASKVLKNTTISLFDQSHKTDTNGEWIYEGLGGNAEVTLFPDDGSPYIPIIHAVDLGESDDLITVILTMEEGVRLYGKVTSNLQNLDSANVTVEGNDLFVALTVNGQYELYVPRGEQRIRAAKQGYMVKKEYHTFVKGTDVELNFELEDGGGRNIAQLLGFDIELEQKTSIGNNQEKWSGKFVHLKPYLSVFKSVGNLSLSFSDIKVSFDENGNAIPEGDKITVAETQLPVDLFNFLPVSFKNGGEPIVVRKNSNGWGSISGQMEFDIDRLLGDYDLKFVRRYYPKIVAQLRGHGTPGDIEFFLGEGASGLPGIGEANTQAILGAATLIPGVQDAYNEVGQYVVDLDELKFRLAPQGTEPLKFELYGFELNIDAANTIVSPQGITLEGNLITPEFGIIKSMDIPLNTVKFNTFLRLTEFDVPEEYLPTLEIGDWKAALTRVNISENGLKLNGNMEFQLPYSEKTLMTMTDLKVSPDGIFGGKFKISGGRLDIFGAADLKNRLEDFSFSQIGSSGIYALTGSAELMLKKLFEERFELDRFMVQTNGVFDIQIPYDYSTDLFSVASFNMNAIRVENPQVGMPYIELLGDIRSNVSLLTFNASNFKLVATQSGSAELVVESIGARINTSILNSSLNLSIVQTGSRKGFSGNGSLTIPSTSIGGEVGFYMFKNSNGSVELGANFKAGVPIPIGVVTINEVGGGFEYSSAGNKFLVNITGAISITGLDAVVELKPISLTVESGPVISGTTGVEVAELTLASASIVLNFPLKNFIITVDSKLEPIKGVAKADIEGLLRISWDNNPYAFLGVNAKINVVNLLNAEGTYVIAVNIRNPKTDTKFSRYFASMPTEYATNKFSGLYSNAQTYFGKKKKWDISIASLTVIFNMVTQAGLILNFQENKYLLSLNGSLAGTVKVGVFWDVIDFGAKYGSCYSLLGSYTPAKGWYVGGDASVSLELYAGSGASRLSCNDYNVMPPAAKVCFGAHASISYQQKGAGSGLSVSGGAGAKGAKCSTSPRVTY